MRETGFCEETIKRAIHTKWAGQTVHFAEETESTNLWTKHLAAQGAPHGSLAVAEFQTAGRGRFARSWQAPAGSSVMMTLLLRPELQPEKAPMLTLVMGLSAAQAVREYGLQPQIKWPNDVVLSGKKICGILTEMSAGMEGIRYVLVGTGINVNLERFPEELRDKATSLCLEAGRMFDRNEVLGLVLKHFEENYERFMRSADFSPLKAEYERLLANRGQKVRILEKDASEEGLCLGIDERGRLLVRKEDGTVEAVGAGEVSVRGLYSYT